MRKFKIISLLGFLAFISLTCPAWAAGEGAPEAPAKAGEPAPQSELDKLKTEWEAVREQQVQMIREKQDQLEKMKEEVFSKMQALKEAEAQSGSQGLESQKKAFQAEQQKFYEEMDRQKENLRRQQAALDEKAAKLEEAQTRFEQEKKTAAPQVS